MNDSMTDGVPRKNNTATITRLAERRLGQATSGHTCPTSSASDHDTICSGGNPAGNGIGEGVVDFASTALWAVIVATIVAAVLLATMLYYTRRRKRRRARERVQALLWHVVRGIENGTVDPVVLDRLVYGPGGSAPYTQTPKLFEASLTEYYGQVNSPEKRSIGDACRWSEMYPISLAPPYALDTLQIRTPRIPILQWPWRHSRALRPKNQTENDPRNSATTQTVARNVDTTLLIVMPHTTPSNTNNHVPPLLVNCPVALASASPSFRDNLLDPAVPQNSGFSELLGTRIVDPFSTLLSTANQRRATFGYEM